MPLSEGLLSISNHLDPSAALTLSPSSRLGHYDILAEPGARGMGVLSRASRATAPPSSPAAFPATRRSWCRLSRPGSLDNLPNAQLCPGNDALQKLMQQFRVRRHHEGNEVRSFTKKATCGLTRWRISGQPVSAWRKGWMIPTHNPRCSHRWRARSCGGRAFHSCRSIAIPHRRPSGSTITAMRTRVHTGGQR